MLNVDSVGRDMVYVVGWMLDDVDTMIQSCHQPATVTVLVLLSSLKGLSPPVTRQVKSPLVSITTPPRTISQEEFGNTE